MAMGGGGSLVAKAYVQIRTDLNLLRSELRQGQSIFRSAVSQMIGVASGILAAAGIRSFMSELRYVVGQFISVNNMFEQYQVSLGQMFKSEALARNMIMEIQEMARKTPFRMDTLTQAIVQLKIFGFENAKLIPTMRAIGDAAAASPRGMLDGVQRISYAIGEMRSHGRIMAAEMRQLASAGVPAWDLLAKKTGKSIGEIRTMMRAGAIDSATYLPMLIEGMAERFEGMMEKQSKTWGGLYSTFQDNMMIMFKDVGRPFFDLAKIRLSNLVSFMDSPRYQQFLPQMTKIVKSVSEFADKKISNALSWLTGPSAYNFAQQMREVAGEVMRIARVGEARAMAFLRSENVQAAAHWIGQSAIWLTRMAGLGFDNVMDFLRGDTWAAIVGGVKEYASQLYGIARMSFDRMREFFSSDNFKQLTGEARKLVGWLMEVRRVAVDFAGDKMSKGLAWLRGADAAYLASQVKVVGLEVKRIATVTASNFWTFFTSDNLRLIATDLKDAAIHVVKIAGVKLVKFSEWLNSAEASAIAAGIRDITKNLIYLIDNYGSLALGIGIMVQFRAQIIALVTTITSGGLLVLLSPTGLLVAGIVAIGAAFVAAKVEGVSFAEYMVMMLGRIKDGADDAADEVSKLKRAEKGEIDLAREVGKANDAMQGDATDEKIVEQQKVDVTLSHQEYQAQEELRKTQRKRADYNPETIVDVMKNDTQQPGHVWLKRFWNAKTEGEQVIERATLDEDVKAAELKLEDIRNNRKQIQEEIKQRQSEMEARNARESADAKIERDADKATMANAAFSSGTLPWGGIAGESAPTAAGAAKSRDLFGAIGSISMHRRAGWLGGKDVGQMMNKPEPAPNERLAAFQKEMADRKREFLGSKDPDTLTKKQAAELKRLTGDTAPADDAPPTGSSKLKNKMKDSDFKSIGVAEFASALQAGVNKSAAEDAAVKTADNTDKTATALEKMQQDGVKLHAGSTLPAATASA